jgi:hypothetical protein
VTQYAARLPGSPFVLSTLIFTMSANPSPCVSLNGSVGRRYRQSPTRVLRKRIASDEGRLTRQLHPQAHARRRSARRGYGLLQTAITKTADRRTVTSRRRGRNGGVREELAAGVILVCAANCPIGENNSSLEMARVVNVHSTITCSASSRCLMPGNDIGPDIGSPRRQARTPAIRGTKRYGMPAGAIIPA